MATIETLQTESSPLVGQTPSAEVISLDDYRASNHGSEGPGYQLIHGDVEVPGTDEPVKYTVSLPDYPQDPHFHLFVPGFGGFKRTSRKIRTALAQNEEIAAVSYEPARHGGVVNDLLHPQRVHADTVSAIAQDLADNQQLQESPASNDMNFDELVLAPHSMGGPAAIDHALRHPNEVSRLILITTVGNEAAVMLGYVPRLGSSGIRELAPALVQGRLGGIKDGITMAKRSFGYYGLNPIRTIGEMASCMLADERENLQEIVEQGVLTAAYLPENDKLIPAESAKKGIGDIVHYLEVADNLDHLAPQVKYERVAADVARISNYLLQV